jgi:hypothetical protein
MSILTKQAKEFQSNLTLYVVGFAAWIIGALVLVGITRRAWGGETAGTLEVLFMFGVAGMLLWTVYYAWLNAYLWFSRNAAGQKREMLESEADTKYRTK